VAIIILFIAAPFIQDRSPPLHGSLATEHSTGQTAEGSSVAHLVRMRAAAIALPFESPKLTAIANLSPSEFSDRFERAITRSGVRLIEAKAGK